ncbi:hypothetical protein D7X30_22335 [Corallococcus sp. AB011P]|nr:hypothetical protein D7X30_22335 [Corallococcus sp. AB011P]
MLRGDLSKFHHHLCLPKIRSLRHGCIKATLGRASRQVSDAPVRPSPRREPPLYRGCVGKIRQTLADWRLWPCPQRDSPPFGLRTSQH